MNSQQQQQLLLLELLNKTFNPEEDGAFLAVAAKETELKANKLPVYIVRVA